MRIRLRTKKFKQVSLWDRHRFQLRFVCAWKAKIIHNKYMVVSLEEILMPMLEMYSKKMEVKSKIVDMMFSVRQLQRAVREWSKVRQVRRKIMLAVMI